MKTNLPESRNRNLPPPPTAGAAVRSRRRLTPEEEPPRGPGVLRNFLAMLVVGGLLFGGIWFYIRGAEADLKIRNEIEASLKAVGAELWGTPGMSGALVAETEEASADLADLPRIMTAVRASAGLVRPEIRIVEGDPPPGNDKASHQILFFLQDRPVLVVIRVLYDRDSGGFTFIGEKNRVVPSRKELEKESKMPAATPSGTPPATPAAPPAPAAPAEKVSEQP